MRSLSIVGPVSRAISQMPGIMTECNDIQQISVDGIMLFNLFRTATAPSTIPLYRHLLEQRLAITRTYRTLTLVCYCCCWCFAPEIGREIFHDNHIIKP